MAVLQRLRTGPSLQTDPELRAYRNLACQRAIRVIFILLLVWLVVDVASFVSGAAFVQSNLNFDLLAIVVISLLTATAWQLTRWGNTYLAGHLLATGFLSFAFANFLVFPQSIYFYNAIFLVPILLAGTIIADRAIFFYALLASIGTFLGWYRGRALQLQPGVLFQGQIAYLFIGSQIVLHQGLAFMLHSLSSHITRSIERLRKQTDAMAQLAHTDALTGLANRRYLIEQLEREFLRAKRYHRPLALLYLDLDRFKLINDQFGHVFGDEILRTIALSMRAVIRTTDLLARIGGDEFAVLLPETTIKGALGVASKLCRALTAFGANLAHTIPDLTFSAGVAQMRFEDDSIDDLLVRADTVQYQAKAAGKGQIRSQLDTNQLPLFEDPQTAAN
ncbi:MAG: GGDEF domain-containing protein [Anaerolineales bacterium]|nr:GGDEF domain-containing protein [Anaerolineales bacterium]